MTNLEYFRHLLNDVDNLDQLFDDTRLNEIIKDNLVLEFEEVYPEDDGVTFNLTHRHIYEGYNVKVLVNGIDYSTEFTIDYENGVLTSSEVFNEPIIVQYKYIKWNHAKADALELIITNFRMLASITAGNSNLSYDDTKRILLDIIKQLRGVIGSDL